MAEHVIVVKCGFDDVDTALEDALESEGIELSDEKFDELVELLPRTIGFKVYFDEDDIEETFDVLDEDWG